MKINKKLISLTFLTAILLLSGGLYFASAIPTGNGNEAGDLDRDRIQDQTHDGDCDRDCICDGPGDCECNGYGPSDGESDSHFGQGGDIDPNLKMVQMMIRWKYQWQRII